MTNVTTKVIMISLEVDLRFRPTDSQSKRNVLFNEYKMKDPHCFQSIKATIFYLPQTIHTWNFYLHVANIVYFAL